jgi:hypothetical protein
MTDLSSITTAGLVLAFGGAAFGVYGVWLKRRLDRVSREIAAATEAARAKRPELVKGEPRRRRPAVRKASAA